MRTRMSGGVGGVTGAIPSPRPDSASSLIWRIESPCLDIIFGARLAVGTIAQDGNTSIV